MQSAPATLQRNQASVSACNQAGQTLLDTIEAEGGIGSDELDAKVSEYLAKTKITVENMNKRRKAIDATFGYSQQVFYLFGIGYRRQIGHHYSL